jgi:hypothetical protein
VAPPVDDLVNRCVDVLGPVQVTTADKYSVSLRLL